MDEAMAEKAIARAIQLTYKNLLQTGEEVHTINSIIDRVAFRDDRPDATDKPDVKKIAEPQNITETLERLQEITSSLLNNAEKLRVRVDKLF